MTRKMVTIAATLVSLIFVIQFAWPHVFVWAFLKSVGQFTEHQLPIAVLRFPTSDATLPAAYAISPDGARIALLYIGSSDQQPGPIAQYQFLDPRTGATTGSVIVSSLPNATSPQKLELAPGLAPAYCDHGKYFYAPSYPGAVSFYDPHSLKLLHSFSLDRLLLEDERFPRSEKRAQSHGDVLFQCANDTPLSIFSFVDSEGYQARIFDLDKMEITSSIPNLQNVPPNPNGQFPSVAAMSADGSMLALQLESGYDYPPDSNLSIVNVTTGRVLHTTNFKEGARFFREVTFAGKGALVIGEAGRCQIYDAVCNQRPAHRTLQVWNFGTDGSQVKLGNFGQETYRSFGASADGSRIYAYAGLETWCVHCDWWNGNLRIKDARFVVWDRKSGKLIYRSPAIPAYHFECPWFSILGGRCYSNVVAPDFSMSANGNAVMVSWFSVAQDATPEGFKDEVEVFELH